jgi:alginate O-acetyltransferase complex protein AlgI
LVAGPIERAVNLLPQLTRPRSPTSAQMGEAAWLIAWGYFMKVFVADNLAPMVDRVFGAPAPTGVEVLVAVYAFTLQVYCDFAGYSNIARGVSKLMGIDLMLNFDLPLFSRTPQERWSRWHISLSSWLRDYLYIPLGGSRGPQWAVNRNLFTTMLLGGLWHGASWNRVLWGAYEGALLVGQRFITLRLGLRRHPTPSDAVPDAPLGMLAALRGLGMGTRNLLLVLVNLHLFCLGLLVFRSHSLSQAWQMLGAVLSDFGHFATAMVSPLSLLYYSALLIAVEVVQYVKRDHLFVTRLPQPAQGIAYGLIAYLVLMHGATSEAFFYFQF